MLELTLVSFLRTSDTLTTIPSKAPFPPSFSSSDSFLNASLIVTSNVPKVSGSTPIQGPSSSKNGKPQAKQSSSSVSAKPKKGWTKRQKRLAGALAMASLATAAAHYGGAFDPMYNKLPEEWRNSKILGN